MEAAIGWTVRLDKEEFMGKDELLRQHADGVDKKMVGFELMENGVARQGYGIQVDGKDAGHVTSGTYSPTLKKSIGLAYVKPEYSSVGFIFDVVIRDKPHKASVVELPFIKR